LQRIESVVQIPAVYSSSRRNSSRMCPLSVLVRLKSHQLNCLHVHIIHIVTIKT